MSKEKKNKFNKEQKLIIAFIIASLIVGIILVVLGMTSVLPTVSVTFGVLMIVFFVMMAPGIVYKIFED